MNSEVVQDEIEMVEHRWSPQEDHKQGFATTSSETWSGKIRPWTCGLRSSNLKRDITAQPWTLPAKIAVKERLQ